MASISLARGRRGPRTYNWLVMDLGALLASVIGIDLNRGKVCSLFSLFCRHVARVVAWGTCIYPYIYLSICIDVVILIDFLSGGVIISRLKTCIQFLLNDDVHKLIMNGCLQVFGNNILQHWDL